MKAKTASKRRPSPLKEGLKKGLDALVVGGGSFGTVLATLLVRNRKKVALWVRRKEQAREINRFHTNKAYFPEAKLPPNLIATTSLRESVAAAPIVIMAIPSKSFREVTRQVGDYLSGEQVLVHATKGIEPETYRRMSEILKEETCALKIGAISGPNLAKELMKGDPAGAVIASHYEEVIQKIQSLFAGASLRLYGGYDIIGAEIGGAFKNIIALVTGCASGMGFGDNTKSLVITRGLFEMAQYGVALGADVFTFGGLAGIGDLMATCNSPLSRNYQVGLRLSKGETLKQILESTRQVAEGVPTTRAVHEQARVLNLDLPFVDAAHATLFEGRTVQDLFLRLSERPTSMELVRLFPR